MERQVLSGAELEESLRSGSLDQADVQIEGMLRFSVERGVTQFSPGDCDTWIDLPVELLESAERTGDQRCRDGINPVFLIKFKQPSDPMGKMLLAALLSALMYA